MIIKKISEVPAEPVTIEGAKEVTVRVIFGPQDRAPTFAMRQFEIAAGGHTPLHSHPYEHEVIVLEGKLEVIDQDKPIALEPGQAVMVEANKKHQFRNTSADKPAKMICLIPAKYQK